MPAAPRLARGLAPAGPSGDWQLAGSVTAEAMQIERWDLTELDCSIYALTVAQNRALEA